MRKLQHLVTFCFLITSCNTNPFRTQFQPEIKICDLLEKQSVYADSMIYLHKLTVLKCVGIFSFSSSEVTDGKCSIILFSTKPYTKNEVIDVKARFKVIFNYNGQTVSALVTDDFSLQKKKMFNF